MEEELDFDFPQIDKPITFADYWDFSRLHGEENEKRVRKINIKLFTALRISNATLILYNLIKFI
jgi:hypothetical protein